MEGWVRISQLVESRLSLRGLADRVGCIPRADAAAWFRNFFVKPSVSRVNRRDSLIPRT